MGIFSFLSGKNKKKDANTNSKSSNNNTPLIIVIYKNQVHWWSNW